MPRDIPEEEDIIGTPPKARGEVDGLALFEQFARAEGIDAERVREIIQGNPDARGEITGTIVVGDLEKFDGAARDVGMSEAVAGFLLSDVPLLPDARRIMIEPIGVLGANGEVVTLSAEITRLRGVIERQRAAACEWGERFRLALHGHEWMAEGRGLYEWDDDRFREEFIRLRDKLHAASDRMLKDLRAHDWTDCPRTAEGVRDARGK